MGVGNVGVFSKTFLSFFYEGMSKIASTQIVPLKNVFVKPNEQSQAPLELCHGEKTKNENQPRKRRGESVSERQKQDFLRF